MLSNAYTALTSSSQSHWTDWQWQQQHAIKSVDELLAVFPDLPRSLVDSVRSATDSRRLQITPYFLSLIHTDGEKASPDFGDPLWKQIIPFWGNEGPSLTAFDRKTPNWEMPSDMVTPIAQHKYENRILVRLANICHAYCQFCYEALRTLEKETDQQGFEEAGWQKTLDYVRLNTKITEVILSGGEPLIYSDSRLRKILTDLRGIGRPIVIRIHTRALTFNPFRITDDFVAMLREFRVGVVGIHVTHPNELGPVFLQALQRLRTAIPIVFTNVPLLRGINDETAVLEKLFWQLYENGVTAGYLYHFMPFSPGVAQFRTTVRKGIDLVRHMKRRISNLAVPEFVVAHSSGKHTVPLLASDEAAPEFVLQDGTRLLRFRNWLGDLVDYPDAES